jgi:two-component system, OmpR family, phosphate regulon sensor histidine kinase PhoR
MGFYTHKGRLMLLLVVLVMLPTAVLTILAGRSIRAREATFRQRLADTAGEQLTAGIASVQAALDRALRDLSAAMDASIASSGAYGALDSAGRAALAPHPIAQNFYVFMAPWGFVYPSAAGNELTPLVTALNRGIATAQPGAAKISIACENRVYCFGRMGARQGLYAGFAVNVSNVVRRLQRELAPLQTACSRVAIDVGLPPSDQSATDADADIVVSDTLDPQPTPVQPADVAVWESLAAGDTLAAAVLRPPLAFIRITISERPAGAVRSSRLWSLLHRWGIVLLAVAICAGSGMVVTESIGLANESRRRTEFVAGMSHDLRTPVTSLRLLAESLYTDRITDAQKRRQFLATIVRESERLSDVIERILFFIRQDNRALTFARNPIDIQELVTAVSAAFADRIAGRATIAVRPGPAAAVVRGDREALSKVLTNLLDNAVKYGLTADNRQVEVTTALRGTRRRPLVEIAVTDRGMGIAHREQRRIFGRFYRVASPAHEHIGGTGLGLALCRDIVRGHGGRIRVTSAPGRGSTFHVLLPGATHREEDPEHDRQK